MARPTSAAVASGVAGHRGVRFDRYLALAACASAGGLVAAEAGAAIVQSAAGWSVTKSVAAPTQSIAGSFGAGAALLNGKFDFRAARSKSVTSSSVSYDFRFVDIRGFNGGEFGKARLAANDVVGPTAPPAGGWTAGGGAAGAVVQSSGSKVGSLWGSTGSFNPSAGWWGQFAGSGTVSIRGFVPIKFTIGAGTHYGYFDLEVFRTGTNGSSAIGFTLHGWAYNDQAGQSITIGAAPSAVPGGAGLAALAFGAAGLRGRRRSRN